MNSLHPTVRPFLQGDVRPTYAFVRIVVPHVTLAAWTAFARGYTSRPGRTRSGGLTARNERGDCAGLALWRVTRNLDHGPILAVDLFIVADFDRPGGARTQLLRGLESLAARRELAAVHVTVSSGPPAVLPPDYHTDATIMCRAVSAPSTRL
jgi:hypothetical protein